MASATGSVELNSAAWGYDSDNDVDYQVGVQYCTAPQATTYESMGIYVPGAYFDATMAVLLSSNADAYAKLSGWDASYPSDYADDRGYVDAQGKSSDFRQELYDPLYYLSAAYEGEGTSKPAAHWRIRTGIEQGDTASTTEVNLALALGMSKQVEDVDFATVWGQGHTMAERTGSSTENFIAWVNGCCK